MDQMDIERMGNEGTRERPAHAAVCCPIADQLEHYMQIVWIIGKWYKNGVRLEHSCPA